MKPSFTNRPQAADMVTEPDPATHGDRFRGNPQQDTCLGILILCVTCGWTGHFCDGSTDHFFNHKCKLRTESVGSGF